MKIYNRKCTFIESVAGLSIYISLKKKTTDFTLQTDAKDGGMVDQSVERSVPGEEVVGSITAVAARSLLVGSISA